MRPAKALLTADLANSWQISWLNPRRPEFGTLTRRVVVKSPRFIALSNGWLTELLDFDFNVFRFCGFAFEHVDLQQAVLELGANF